MSDQDTVINFQQIDTRIGKIRIYVTTHSLIIDISYDGYCWAQISRMSWDSINEMRQDWSKRIDNG